MSKGKKNNNKRLITSLKCCSDLKFLNLIFMWMPIDTNHLYQTSMKTNHVSHGTCPHNNSVSPDRTMHALQKLLRNGPKNTTKNLKCHCCLIMSRRGGAVLAVIRVTWGYACSSKVFQADGYQLAST